MEWWVGASWLTDIEEDDADRAAVDRRTRHAEAATLGVVQSSTSVEVQDGATTTNLPAGLVRVPGLREQRESLPPQFPG